MKQANISEPRRQRPAGGLAEAPLRHFDADDERLARYQPLHATRAELLARAGDLEAAADAYRQAIALTLNPAERAALQARAARYGCPTRPASPAG